MNQKGGAGSGQATDLLDALAIPRGRGSFSRFGEKPDFCPSVLVGLNLIHFFDFRSLLRMGLLTRRKMGSNMSSSWFKLEDARWSFPQFDDEPKKSPSAETEGLHHFK